MSYFARPTRTLPHESMAKTAVRFTSYPRTEPPPEYIPKIVAAFRQCESGICTTTLEKGFTPAYAGLSQGMSLWRYALEAHSSGYWTRLPASWQSLNSGARATS